MLNFIYWPISIVLWLWHKLFALFFGPDNAASWILAIVLLTFTLRLLLYVPMRNQQRSMVKMQKVQPRMMAIREKYKNDRQRMMEETRKLQKEMGVNPLAGCLPVFAQIPVFIGLFHVLRSFNRTGDGPGQVGLSPEENYNTANYVFSVEEVRSFLDADLFGVPLSSYIAMPRDMWAAFPNAGEFDRWRIVAVAAPLILIIVFATHMNARMSLRRQEKRRAEGKQAAPQNEMMETQQQMMSKLMLWFMPLTILFTGVIWHVGMLFYMVSNNIWTFFQNRHIFALVDREEAEEDERIKAKKRTTAPKPGQKPKNNTKKRGGKNKKK